MLQSMTWLDFLGWVAYSQVEPFDERRADYRTASIVTMLANINRDSSKRSTPYKVEDFVIPFDLPHGAPVERRKQSLEMQKSFLMAIGIVSAAGGMDES